MRFYSEDLKCVSGRENGVIHPEDAFAVPDVNAADGQGGKVSERSLSEAKLLIHPPRNSRFRALRSRKRTDQIDPREFGRPRRRQAAQEKSMQQREDGCIRPDSDGERENGGETKDRPFAQYPQAVAKVLPERLK